MMDEAMKLFGLSDHNNIGCFTLSVTISFSVRTLLHWVCYLVC